MAGELGKIYSEYDSFARGVDIDNPIAPSSLPRGYGGIAIMWKKSLTPLITKKTNGNNRIICIVLKNCYIINVYFPSGHDTSSIESHLECADVLDSIIQSIEYDKHIIIAGDWNIDLFKAAYKKDKRRLKIIALIKSNNLICLSGNPKPTYGPDNNGHTSHIDYILARNTSNCCFSEYQALIHEKVPWNTSQHTPVSLNLDITIPLRPKEKHIIIKKLKVNWNSLNKTQYDTIIRNSMSKIKSTSNQKDILEKSVNLLKHAVKRSAETKVTKNIPQIKRPWNREIANAVADVKQTFYTMKCRSAEQKDVTDLEEILKMKRKKVRAAHRKYNAIQRRKILANITEAALKKDAKEVSKVIKSINGGKSEISPLNIDGETIYDVKSCASKWADYYQTLASPDETNPNMDNSYLEVIKETVMKIRKTLAMTNEPLQRKATKCNIANAIKKLNSGKAPDEKSLVAEYLKYSDMAPSLLQILVQKVIDEGCVNKCLKSSLKNSIPKKDKDKMIQDHYRGIAITLLFMKIIEHVLLDCSGLEDHTHEMQFGFTKGRSPDMAAVSLTECIVESAETLNNLIIISLDTKKAFDLVHHDILRYKLYNKNIHPRLWKIFDSLLKDQTEKARWGSHISKEYNIKQGTGQGKVLGAPFYKLFIEDVLVNLNDLGLGFYIGDIPMNCPTCADDLLVMADGPLCAQIMCQSVEISSKKDRSTQQPTKSRISKNIDIVMNGALIPHEPSFTHIGIERYLDGHDQLISERIATANNTVYALIPCGLHGNGLSPNISKGLIIQYVNPRLINGIHAITLLQRQREKMFRAQLKMIKNMQCLRQQTSNAIALLMYGILPIYADLDIRILGLFGAICRLDEEQPLKRLAKRQLSIKCRKSKSWFIQAKLIGEPYGINLETALILNWSKDSWGNYIKHTIKSYWFKQLMTEAMSKSSLIYVNFDLFEMNTVHPVWPESHKQYLITCAAYRAKMLSGSYILQSTTAKFNQYRVDGTCKLCKESDEDMIHFLLKCKTLNHVRKKYMKRITRYIKYEKIDAKTETDLLKLILNGVKCSTDKLATEFNNTCSKLCHKLHKERFDKLSEMEPNRKRKKKKKTAATVPNTPKDPNACLHCKNQVKDDDETMQCDVCKGWQHIRCRRIIGVRLYRKICMGLEPEVSWRCKECK